MEMLDSSSIATRLTGKTVVVFTGPPLSGKSTLAKAFASRNRIAYLSMDEIRVRIFPDSDNRRDHRQEAYRQMHARAEQLLATNNPIVLDATYAPHEQRRALRQVAQSTVATGYVFECFVDPKTATARFCDRPNGHPASDLTVRSVLDLAIDYPFSGQVGEANTSGTIVVDAKTLTSDIETLLTCCGPTNLDTWVEFAPAIPFRPEGRHQGDRLSPKIIRQAHLGFWLQAVLFPASLAFALAALYLLVFGLRKSGDSAVKALAAADVCAGLAVVAGGIVPLLEFLKSRHTIQKSRIKAGSLPNFSPHDARPSDAALFRRYRARAKACATASQHWIQDVPVFYLVPPEKGLLFQVEIQQANRDFRPESARLLEREAARFGLDWQSFVAWRKADVKREYPGKFADRCGIRAVSRPQLISGKQPVCYRLEVAKCQYLDYRCTDTAVNLYPVEGLGDLRRLFEGQGWDSQSIDLCDVREASDRYSMLINVNVLVSAKDGSGKEYLVLTKRSSYISEGGGYFATTASGASEWDSDFNPSHGSDGIKLAALRELREETGIKPDHLDNPAAPCFMAAAFNLLHGRDLSFYAHFRSNLKVGEIWDLVRKARDHWEMQHLILVPTSEIDPNGKLKGHFASIQPACNRHLIAALRAFAISVNR